MRKNSANLLSSPLDSWRPPPSARTPTARLSPLLAPRGERAQIDGLYLEDGKRLVGAQTNGNADSFSDDSSSSSSSDGPARRQRRKYSVGTTRIRRKKKSKKKQTTHAGERDWSEYERALTERAAVLVGSSSDTSARKGNLSKLISPKVKDGSTIKLAPLPNFANVQQVAENNRMFESRLMRLVENNAAVAKTEKERLKSIYSKPLRQTLRFSSPAKSNASTQQSFATPVVGPFSPLPSVPTLQSPTVASQSSSPSKQRQKKKSRHGSGYGEGWKAGMSQGSASGGDASAPASGDDNSDADIRSMYSSILLQQQNIRMSHRNRDMLAAFKKPPSFRTGTESGLNQVLDAAIEKMSSFGWKEPAVPSPEKYLEHERNPMSQLPETLLLELQQTMQSSPMLRPLTQTEWVERMQAVYGPEASKPSPLLPDGVTSSDDAGDADVEDSFQHQRLRAKPIRPSGPFGPLIDSARSSGQVSPTFAMQRPESRDFTKIREKSYGTEVASEDGGSSPMQRNMTHPDALLEESTTSPTVTFKDGRVPMDQQLQQHQRRLLEQQRSPESYQDDGDHNSDAATVGSRFRKTQTLELLQPPQHSPLLQRESQHKATMKRIASITRRLVQKQKTVSAFDFARAKQALQEEEYDMTPAEGEENLFEIVDVRKQRRHFDDMEPYIQRLMEKRGPGGQAAAQDQGDNDVDDGTSFGLSQEDAFRKALDAVQAFNIMATEHSKHSSTKIQRKIAKLRALGEKAWVRITSNLHQAERAKAMESGEGRVPTGIAEKLLTECDTIATKLLRTVGDEGGTLDMLPKGIVLWMKKRNEFIAARQGAMVSQTLAAKLNPIVHEVCEINAAIVLGLLRLKIAKQLRRTSHPMKARMAIAAATKKLEKIDKKANIFRKKLRKEKINQNLLPEYVRNFINGDEAATVLWQKGTTDPDVCVLVADVRKVNAQVHAAMRTLAKSFGPNKGPQRARALKDLEIAEAEAKCLRKEVQGYDVSKLPRFARNFFTMPMRANMLLLQGWTDEKVCTLVDICQDVLQRVRRVRGRPTHGILETSVMSWVDEQALVDGYEEDMLRARELYQTISKSKKQQLPSWLVNMMTSKDSASKLWDMGKIDPEVCELADGVKAINDRFDRARDAERRRENMIAAGHMIDPNDMEHGIAETVDEEAEMVKEDWKKLRTRYRTLGLPRDRIPPYVLNFLELDHISPRSMWQQGLTNATVVMLEAELDKVVALIESVELLPKQPTEDEFAYGEMFRAVLALPQEVKDKKLKEADALLTALRCKAKEAGIPENTPESTQIVLNSNEPAVALWRIGMFGSRAELVRQRAIQQQQQVKEAQERLQKLLQEEQEEKMRQLEQERQRKLAAEEVERLLYDSSEEDAEAVMATPYPQDMYTSL